MTSPSSTIAPATGGSGGTLTGGDGGGGATELVGPGDGLDGSLGRAGGGGGGGGLGRIRVNVSSNCTLDGVISPEATSNSATCP
jgi:hypothetical protein